jgi:hypothetical protein
MKWLTIANGGHLDLVGKRHSRLDVASVMVSNDLNPRIDVTE